MAVPDDREDRDGRRLRTLRSYRLILDAGTALMTEGNPLPTAQQIAQRAGLSVRSLHQHFGAVENVLAEATAEHLTRAARATITVQPQWPIDHKVDRVRRTAG